MRKLRHRELKCVLPSCEMHAIVWRRSIFHLGDPAPARCPVHACSTEYDLEHPKGQALGALLSQLHPPTHIALLTCCLRADTARASWTTAKTLKRGAMNSPGTPPQMALKLAGSGKPALGLAGAWQKLSAEGQGTANLTPPNSNQLSQRRPSSLKTSQRPLSHRDTRSQRGQQSGCFRPRPQPRRMDQHGGPCFTGGPGTSEP